MEETQDVRALEDAAFAKYVEEAAERPYDPELHLKEGQKAETEFDMTYMKEKAAKKDYRKAALGAEADVSYSDREELSAASTFESHIKEPSLEEVVQRLEASPDFLRTFRENVDRLKEETINKKKTYRAQTPVEKIDGYFYMGRILREQLKCHLRAAVRTTQSLLRNEVSLVAERVLLKLDEVLFEEPLG